MILLQELNHKDQQSRSWFEGLTPVKLKARLRNTDAQDQRLWPTFSGTGTGAP